MYINTPTAVDYNNLLRFSRTSYNTNAFNLLYANLLAPINKDYFDVAYDKMFKLGCQANTTGLSETSGMNIYSIYSEVKEN